jgi:hypothetical protein
MDSPSQSSFQQQTQEPHRPSRPRKLLHRRWKLPSTRTKAKFPSKPPPGMIVIHAFAMSVVILTKNVHQPRNSAVCTRHSTGVRFQRLLPALSPKQPSRHAAILQARLAPKLPPGTAAFGTIAIRVTTNPQSATRSLHDAFCFPLPFLPRLPHLVPTRFWTVILWNNAIVADVSTCNTCAKTERYENHNSRPFLSVHFFGPGRISV